MLALFEATSGFPPEYRPRGLLYCRTATGLGRSSTTGACAGCDAEGALDKTEAGALSVSRDEMSMLWLETTCKLEQGPTNKHYSYATNYIRLNC